MFENSSRRFKAQQADFFRKLCLFQLEINCALTIFADRLLILVNYPLSDTNGLPTLQTS